MNNNPNPDNNSLSCSSSSSSSGSCSGPSRPTATATTESAAAATNAIGSNESRPKTWAELKSVVNDFRRQMMSLSCLFPMNIKFRTLPDGRIRIYFLSIPPHGFGDTTLIWVDVGPEEPSHEMYPQRYVRHFV